MVQADTSVLDRTSARTPLVLSPGTSLEVGILIDRNLTRPSIVVTEGASLTVGAMHGAVPRDYTDGSGLPRTEDVVPGVNMAGVSGYDLCRARVAVIGHDSKVVVARMSKSCEVGVMVAPPHGTGPVRGVALEVARIDGGRFPVLAAGTDRLRVTVTDGTVTPRQDGPAGHLVYLNEVWHDGRFVRTLDPQVRIEKASASGWGDVDWCTFKAKGVSSLGLVIADDRNDWGSLDLIDCTGVASSHWRGAGRNRVFAAFRTTHDQFGGRFGMPPLGDMVVTDSEFVLVPSLAFKRRPPSYRSETPRARFERVTVTGGAPPVVWPGCQRA